MSFNTFKGTILTYKTGERPEKIDPQPMPEEVELMVIRSINLWRKHMKKLTAQQRWDARKDKREIASIVKPAESNKKGTL